MKKIITWAFLLAFTTTSFCQQTVQKPSLATTDYLQKSKKKKKATKIFLGGGAALIITRLIIRQEGPAAYQIDINPITGWFYEGHKNDGIKAAFGLTGVAAMLGSIPFFIASGKNKRRANAISATLKADNASIIRSYSKVSISYPALSIKKVLH